MNRDKFPYNPKYILLSSEKSEEHIIKLTLYIDLW